MHPLTIISTLPSAGLGALLALQVTNTPLTVIAFVGIILLIGIVKKNGIMMVDFALDAERNRGLSSADAIFEACRARFRPILMTTLAALFAGIPLVIATGPGTELRRPLGITIIGGLFVSQILTLYTTPVIYLLIDRLRQRRAGRPDPCARGIVPELLKLGSHEAYSGRMSEQPRSAKSAAAEEVVPDCPHCGKPLPLCICDSVTPIESRISLLILQHPQEQDRALGTARLTAQHFNDAVLKIGLSWPSLSKALGRTGARSLALGGALSRFCQGQRSRDRSRDRRDQPQGRGRAAPARHPLRHRRHRAARRNLEPGQGAVVAQCVDAEVPAGDSRPKRPSRYGKLRKEPRGDGLSTIEAAAMLLAGLEKRPKSPKRSTQFRADAGTVSGSAGRNARARAQAEEEGLSPPQGGKPRAK